MKYDNYDVQQDGMDSKAHKELLPQGESGIAVCASAGLMRGHWVDGNINQQEKSVNSEHTEPRGSSSDKLLKKIISVAKQKNMQNTHTWAFFLLGKRYFLMNEYKMAEEYIVKAM